MHIYSYVTKTVEQNGWTGVCRFDRMLRKVFPDLRSVTQLLELKADDVVITDNHLSLNVPPEIKTIVVHHGCAATHYERDRFWRNAGNASIVELQKKMFELPNRTYVAPSVWVGVQFRQIAPVDYKFQVIPHWVESIQRVDMIGKPVIIGDWRDHNKGFHTWKHLARAYPQWTFQPLNFRNDVGRYSAYGMASLYLCLSQSEGGPYSVCDAEAAGLPIVTTDVGNYIEFIDSEVFDWKQRDKVDIVGGLIERKLRLWRKRPSFYRDYTFERWKSDWEALL